MLANKSTPMALEILATAGRIEVNVLPRYEPQFRKLYKALTGRAVAKGSYNVALDPKKKGGNQLRLILGSSDERDKRTVEEGLGITFGKGPGGKGWRKGDNDLCIDLISMGLDIGGRSPWRKLTLATVRQSIKQMKKVQKEYLEGFRREVTREVAKRNQGLVDEAKERYGRKCLVCGFDFRMFYGPHGQGFIEGHHKKPLAEYEREGRPVTVEEIAPVCSNCHRMLHRGKKVMSVTRLREIIRRSGIKVEWPWD